MSGATKDELDEIQEFCQNNPLLKQTMSFTMGPMNSALSHNNGKSYAYKVSNELFEPGHH